MIHTLPELPYDLDALNPHLSRQTLEFHHGKHHLTYVNTLNTLIPGTRFEDADLETMICEASDAIFNNAAQIWNHTFYFAALSNKPKPEPEGELRELLLRDFETLDVFRATFLKSALTLFGAGWAWLVFNPEEGSLQIRQESNAGNPLRNGLKPLLTCDVWEHAYYLDYQNRRVDYLEEFWKLIDWRVVESRWAVR